MFCNISVWGVINYSAVQRYFLWEKTFKCDGLCKYLSPTKLLYFSFSLQFVDRYDDKVLVIMKVNCFIISPTHLIDVYTVRLLINSLLYFVYDQ